MVIEIRIIENTIARDWVVLDDGRTYDVNLTERDGQTLATGQQGELADLQRS